MTDQTLEDLKFLQENAFHFSLEVNPHAPFHDTMVEELGTHRGEDDEEDWLSAEDRRAAYNSGKYIECSLYPLGSVSFYTLRGTNADDLIAAAAKQLREDLKRDPDGKRFASQAFTPQPL